jgi:hypothetical protein
LDLVASADFAAPLHFAAGGDFSMSQDLAKPEGV